MMKKIVILAGLGLVVFVLLRRNAQAAYYAPQYYEPGFVYVPPANSQDLIDDAWNYEYQQNSGDFVQTPEAVYIPANEPVTYTPEPLDNWDLQGEQPAPISTGWNVINDALNFLTGGTVTPASMNAQQNGNVAAFLAMIREAEGTSGPDGYRTLFGGGLFDSFDSHPRTVVTATLGGKPISSSAAGAYQALSRTWDDFIRAVGPRDFSPASQDEFAIWAIRRRGALNDVIAGRFAQAVAKTAKEWASLPGSPYGQPTISMDKAVNIYAANGGQFETGATYT